MRNWNVLNNRYGELREKTLWAKKSCVKVRMIPNFISIIIFSLELCSVSNKLDNKCDPKDLHCVEVLDFIQFFIFIIIFQVELDNDNPLACDKKLFFADDNNQMVISYNGK